MNVSARLVQAETFRAGWLGSSFVVRTSEIILAYQSHGNYSTQLKKGRKKPVQGIHVIEALFKMISSSHRAVSGLQSCNREIKLDVTWSHIKRQTVAKMKLLPSVFSSLNSRVKIFVFLGFTWRHKPCSNQCPPCWWPSGVKFMLLIGHFYSEASLLSLSYFANDMNIQKEKNDKSTRHSSKGILVLSEYAKSLQRRVQEIYSLWPAAGQGFKISKWPVVWYFSQILRNGRNPSNSNYHMSIENCQVI